MSKLLIAIFIFTTAIYGNAQKLDASQLYLFDIVGSAKNGYSLENPQFLTAFNPKGYNNQPAFITNELLYFATQQPSDTTQTDIMALNLSAHTKTVITQTRTPEYSPTPVPGGDAFSVVRVERDQTQRLWSFPMDRSTRGKPVFPKVKGVGYHCWLDHTTAALFIVGQDGESHSLQIIDTERQKLLKISTNIGRCLLKMPDGRLAYVQKATEQTWFIKAYDPKKQFSEILFKSLPEVEDFAILPSGTFLAAKGPKLYQFTPGIQTEWKEIGDLSAYHIKFATRWAISPNGAQAVLVVK